MRLTAHADGERGCLQAGARPVWQLRRPTQRDPNVASAFREETVRAPSRYVGQANARLISRPIPAAEPGESPCAAVHTEHSPSTVGTKGPTATPRDRTGYHRPVDDLFATDITSRHSVSEESCRHRDYADHPNINTATTCPPLQTSAYSAGRHRTSPTCPCPTGRTCIWPP